MVNVNPPLLQKKISHQIVAESNVGQTPRNRRRTRPGNGADFAVYVSTAQEGFFELAHFRIF
jgi:hypothetical protein